MSPSWLLELQNEGHFAFVNPLSAETLIIFAAEHWIKVSLMKDQMCGTPVRVGNKLEMLVRHSKHEKWGKEQSRYGLQSRFQHSVLSSPFILTKNGKATIIERLHGLSFSRYLRGSMKSWLLPRGMVSSQNFQLEKPSWINYSLCSKGKWDLWCALFAWCSFSFQLMTPRRLPFHLQLLCFL